MKPAAFRYHRPSTVAEAAAALGEGEEAKLLAGGQSLVPLLNLRLAQPTDLVDLSGVQRLDGIVRERGAIRVGAMVRQADAERDDRVRDAAPLIVAALGHVGHPQIRARGTVGGSVAHADPAAELPAALLALDGEVVAEGPNGRRTIAAEDYFEGIMTTSLAPDEVLVEVRIPDQGSDGVWGCTEIARRRGDYALAGAMVTARGSGGAIEESRVVLFSVAGVPLRMPSVENVLAGRSIQDAGVRREAAKIASEELEPATDLHATPEFKRHLAGVVVRRALEQAAEASA